MIIFKTEFNDIKAYMDNGALIRYEYSEGANQEVKPKYYRAGDFLYLIGGTDEDKANPLKRVSTGKKQNCNLDSNKYKGG